MKKAMMLLVFMLGALVWAQDQSTIITVKKTATSNGVVIVTVTPAAATNAKASFELHCNQGASACQAPAPGKLIRWFGCPRIGHV